MIAIYYEKRNKRDCKFCTRVGINKYKAITYTQFKIVISSKKERRHIKTRTHRTEMN